MASLNVLARFALALALYAGGIVAALAQGSYQPRIDAQKATLPETPLSLCFKNAPEGARHDAWLDACIARARRR
jgi:hypothetical protein